MMRRVALAALLGALHDRAVLAIGAAGPGAFPSADLRERVDAGDAARALYARGVHRLRAGEHDAGVRDLRESLRYVRDRRVEAVLDRALSSKRLG